MYLPKIIKWDRERKRLEALAAEKGYESLESMLHDLYIVRHVPLIELQQILVTPMHILRNVTLPGAGITIRSKGGRNNVQVEITPELIEEIKRDGIPAVSMRSGIHEGALYLRMREWYRKYGDGKNE